MNTPWESLQPQEYPLQRYYTAADIATGLEKVGHAVSKLKQNGCWVILLHGLSNTLALVARRFSIRWPGFGNQWKHNYKILSAHRIAKGFPYLLMSLDLPSVRAMKTASFGLAHLADLATFERSILTGAPYFDGK